MKNESYGAKSGNVKIVTSFLDVVAESQCSLRVRLRGKMSVIQRKAEEDLKRERTSSQKEEEGMRVVWI